MIMTAINLLLHALSKSFLSVSFSIKHLLSLSKSSTRFSFISQIHLNCYFNVFGLNTLQFYFNLWCSHAMLMLLTMTIGGIYICIWVFTCLPLYAYLIWLITIMFQSLALRVFFMVVTIWQHFFHTFLHRLYAKVSSVRLKNAFFESLWIRELSKPLSPHKTVHI